MDHVFHGRLGLGKDSPKKITVRQSINLLAYKLRPIVWDPKHPQKLTWQWKITMFNRRYIFKWLFFPLSVVFREVISTYLKKGSWSGIVTLENPWKCDPGKTMSWWAFHHLVVFVWGSKFPTVTLGMGNIKGRSLIQVSNEYLDAF